MSGEDKQSSDQGSRGEGRKIGVFICHCGGNISDYVDVARVRDAVSEDPGVAVASTEMFACSDAAQQEMIDAIESGDLDGLVVASCSPTLHLHTFRGVAERAGLNPYRYVQVNLREQDSWAHRDDMEAATLKGIDLVRAGIARARLSQSLETFRVETTPSVLVVGAGVAGMRAALALSDLGLAVHIVERAQRAGGWTAELGKTFPNDRDGGTLIGELVDAVRQRPNISLYTGAEVTEQSGSVGDFSIKVRLSSGDTLSLEVGAIVVATGFDTYTPADGEFGYGSAGVITLPEFRKIVDKSDGELVVGGKRIHTLAYVYCVGSRQQETPDRPDAHTYCSRFCCTATVHTALAVHGVDPALNQYHLYRDIRTYGKNELLFEEAGRQGSVFVRFDAERPPTMTHDGDRMIVTVADLLDGGEEIQIPVDLVVLVTGMVPRANEELEGLLKLPLGRDGFFNEIHPKLRPVETVIDGVFIAGASQGPKTISESVASSMAAASKSAALLLKGHVDLEPFIATVDVDRCTWCGECIKACPYLAIEKVAADDGREVARIIPSLCKGGGACVPVCPTGAIDLVGYDDEEITAMIDALVGKVVV